MSIQHFRQPLIVISPVLQSYKMSKKGSISNIFRKQARNSTVQEVIFSMRYKEKYQQKQKQSISRTERIVPPRKQQDDFQGRLMQVLKKQNSAMLTRNLVNISFVNGLQCKKLENMRNSVIIHSSRDSKECVNQKHRYSTNALLAQAKNKDRTHFRRTCQFKQSKNGQNKWCNVDDHEFEVHNQPCTIFSLKLKNRPNTSKLVQKSPISKIVNGKLRFTVCKNQYRERTKNKGKLVKRQQDLLQPWDLQQNDQWS